MRAVLLVAGDARGSGDTRACPWTTPLFPVANRALLDHALCSLRDGGVGEVGVIADPGALGDAVRDWLGEGRRWELDVSWLDPVEPFELADAMLAAESFVDDSPFVLHDGSGLLRVGLGPLAEPVVSGAADAVVLARRGGAVAEPGYRWHDGILEEATGEQPVVGGLFVFAPSIFDVLHGLAPRWDGTRGIGDALRGLADSGGRLKVALADACWAPTGGPERLLELNRMLLDEIAGDPVVEDRPGTRVRGRVQIDPSAELRDALVVGPAVIGAGARIVAGYVGPYTSVGEGAVIEGAELADSVVLPGAVVRNVGPRIEGSIIGEGARVGRRFEPPAVLRLRVGTGAEVALS